MHAAMFSRGEGRAMGSVRDEVAAIDSRQRAFTCGHGRRRKVLTMPRSGGAGMRNEIP